MIRILGLFLLLPAIAQAGLLEVELGDKKIEGVQIAAKAKLNAHGASWALQFVGAGLRYKKVLFVKAKVYVGQLFVSDAASFARDEGAVASLDKSIAVAMQMNFLRDVDAKTLDGAFREAFKENGIDVAKDPVSRFLTAVATGAGAVEGKAITVAAEIKDKLELVTYEDSSGKQTTITGGSGFIKQIFSLWLGKPTDSGVENLKKEILAK